MTQTIPHAQLLQEAEMAAILAHKGQTYDIFPYEKHLRDVVAILQRYGYEGNIIIAGWLHDAIEDTTLTFNKIKNAFGVEVAEIVFAVTDELGRNRKERKEKTYPKIIACGEKAVSVKIADRIANIEHGIRMGNDITQMYRDEYNDFYKHLHEDNTIADPLWKHLSDILKTGK